MKYPVSPISGSTASTKTPFTIGDITIIPIQVWHLKMPVLGFRFGDFTYITDANRIEESEREKIRGSEQIVLTRSP